MCVGANLDTHLVDTIPYYSLEFADPSKICLFGIPYIQIGNQKISLQRSTNAAHLLFAQSHVTFRRRQIVTYFYIIQIN